MNQLFTHLVLFSGLITLFLQCGTERTCYELAGRWTTREGQTLVFEPKGQSLWLIKFGSQFDTLRFRYQYDCTQNPLRLDLSDFHAGPMAGKTLYGILEWSSDSMFRFEAQAGGSAEVRPSAFKAEQAVRYYRVR